MAALGEQRLFLRIEEEEKEEEEEEVAESRWGGQFLVKVVAVPVVVRRQVLGSPWCASATDHGLRGGDSACACLSGADRGVPMPQIMEVFVVPPITEGNHGGDSAGDKVVDMLVIVQRQVLGETEQKTAEVPQFRSLGVVQFLDKVVDTPAGVQPRVFGPDCAENRDVSAVAALARVCPGSAGQVFGALDDEEFFIIEGSLGVALTPGVLVPGVRPPVDATISGKSCACLLDRSCVDRHMR